MMDVSPSARRAWIEILKFRHIHNQAHVALRTEGVDRNVFRQILMRHFVDVALRTEGVDRNMEAARAKAGGKLSPSARRAWIEIGLDSLSGIYVLVALRTEGVDRNSNRVVSY